MGQSFENAGCNITTDCLSPFGLLKQNTADWVAHEQQKLISHNSGAWKSEMTAWAELGERPLLGHRLLVTLLGGRGLAALWGLFIRA